MAAALSASASNEGRGRKVKAADLRAVVGIAAKAGPALAASSSSPGRRLLAEGSALQAAAQALDATCAVVSTAQDALLSTMVGQACV